MALSVDETYALVGLLLGVAFVISMLPAGVVSFYVPSLEDWNYYKTVSMDIYTSYEFNRLLRFNLPPSSDTSFWSHVDDDCNDLRFTYGTGDSEVILPYALESCAPSKKAFVLVPSPSASVTLRMYYGNPDASPQEPLGCYSGGKLYAFKGGYCPPTFTCTPTDDTCFYSGSYFYIVDDADADYSASVSEVPLSPYVTYRITFTVGACDSLDLNFLFPGLRVYVWRSASNKYSFCVADSSGCISTVRTKSKNSFTNLYLYFSGSSVVVKDGGTVIYSTDTYSGQNPSFSFDVRATDCTVKIKNNSNTYALYSHTSASADYSEEHSAPKAPVIDVSPHGGLFSQPVDVSVSISDSDLNYSKVVLDGNTVCTGTSCVVHLTEDGVYSLYVYADDSEGIVSEYSDTYDVDLLPPEVNISNISYSSGVLTFDVNASDRHLSYCTLDSNTVSCSDTLSYEGASVEFCAYDTVGHVRCVLISAPPSGGSSGGSTGGTVIQTVTKTTRPSYAVSVSYESSSSSPLSAVTAEGYKYIGLIVVVFVLFILSARYFFP